MIDAGITWIGPSPEAISALGDKVQARHIAEKVGAPQVPGTADPVESAEEILDFVDKFGLPVAIKAAFGGGGRGIKVARTREEIPELFESAVREATAAFGRGECFIERFLDAPRHVETQCLADAHGNVVVVSTRDCSLQRRNQKLVEEAPAPFLTEEQNRRLYESSKAILKEAGYLGAGTCEFLVGQDGTISFLEVNTRLQVEHCVSEEVTGIDLVREQFRLARGEELGYGDPEVRGHSIEFRITGEDPGRNFMPAPGTITTLQEPHRPRCPHRFRRGAGRRHQRQLRLHALQADRHRRHPHPGPAAVPARAGGNGGRRHPHRHPVRPRGGFQPGLRTGRGPLQGPHPLDRDRPSSTTFRPGPRPAPRLKRPTPATASASSSRSAASAWKSCCRRRWARSATPAGAKPAKAKKRTRSGGAPVAASGNALTSPMQGTIVKVAVAEGDTVAEGDLVVVLEAMKMEQPLTAHRAGIVIGLSAAAGETVSAGAIIAMIEDGAAE